MFHCTSNWPWLAPFNYSDFLRKKIRSLINLTCFRPYSLLIFQWFPWDSLVWKTDTVIYPLRLLYQIMLNFLYALGRKIAFNVCWNNILLKILNSFRSELTCMICAVLIYYCYLFKDEHLKSWPKVWIQNFCFVC